MKKDHIPEDLHNEYAEFLAGSSASVPRHVTQNVVTEITRYLNPPPHLVFIKLSAMVFVIGVLNLMLCPQFGVGTMRESGLMEFFMLFGHNGCRIACGIFFLGTALFAASFLLLPEDLRVIRRSPVLFTSALSALSLLSFVALGGTVYFEAAAFWLIGSILGGIASLEVGWSLRHWAAEGV